MFKDEFLVCGIVGNEVFPYDDLVALFRKVYKGKPLSSTQLTFHYLNDVGSAYGKWFNCGTSNFIGFRLTCDNKLQVKINVCGIPFSVIDYDLNDGIIIYRHWIYEHGRIKIQESHSHFFISSINPSMFTEKDIPKEVNSFLEDIRSVLEDDLLRASFSVKFEALCNKLELS